MKEITLEWVHKAEGDYRLAYLALEADGQPIPEGVCFHSQQCAEKYLKAYLQEQNAVVPRSHTLIPLLVECLSFDENFENLRADLLDLEGYAVAVRYPGANVSIELAQAAFNAATRVREFLRYKVDLGTSPNSV